MKATQRLAALERAVGARQTIRYIFLTPASNDDSTFSGYATTLDHRNLKVYGKNEEQVLDVLGSQLDEINDGSSRCQLIALRWL